MFSSLANKVTEVCTQAYEPGIRGLLRHRLHGVYTPFQSRVQQQSASSQEIIMTWHKLLNPGNKSQLESTTLIKNVEGLQTIICTSCAVHYTISYCTQKHSSIKMDGCPGSFLMQNCCKTKATTMGVVMVALWGCTENVSGHWECNRSSSSSCLVVTSYHNLVFKHRKQMQDDVPDDSKCFECFCRSLGRIISMN